MEDLKRYLVRLPQALGFQDEKKIKVNVYKALYYAVTVEAAYLDLLFSKIPPEDVVALRDYLWPPKLNRRRPFYKYVLSVRYTHPHGQVCGRNLEKGEPVYRCEDCGYDDTCVLCVHCFNRADHVNHSVSVYSASSDSSGMCDCGDETAFPVDLNCACQAELNAPENLPHEFKQRIRDTLAVVLDYILDVTNFSINSLPVVHKNINGRGDLKISSKQISDFGSLPSDVYGAEDVNSDDMWYLVLWNDENHDYLEAETGIRAATGVSDARAKEIASEINSHGRAVLKSAKDYSDLLKGQKSAEADGLVATICTARDYMREVIVLLMFEWIKDVISFSGNSLFREFAKYTLGELLLEPGFKFSKIIPAEFFKSDKIDIKKASFQNGLLYNGELVNLALTKLRPAVSTSSLMSSVHELLRPPFETVFANSRIQFLLAFEIRFVLAIRYKFRTSILPVLFIDPVHKQTFCEQYLDVYPILFNILALSDREENMASTSDISVQLFTCPRTNLWVVNSGKLGNILGPLSTLIEDHSSKVNSSGYPNLINLLVDIRSKREKSSIQKTIDDAIATISRIISKNDTKDMLDVFLHHDNLVFFLLFLRYFQGTSSVQRKYGDHVERESLKDFFIFVQRCFPILGMVKHAAMLKQLDPKVAQHGIVWILEFLNLRKIHLSAPGIADFRVSKDEVSNINPINAFLSHVLQASGVDEVSDYLQNSSKPFMQVSDFSLRSIVFLAQVKVGFWIRNGVTVSRQAAYYTDLSIAEIGYYRDIHLNQVAAIFDNPKITLYNILDRWELLTWYSREVDHEHTIYEDRFGYMCEQLILFLYTMLCDRTHFTPQSSQNNVIYQVKQAICYSLCDEPKSYTELKKLLPSFALEMRNLDDIILECADYRPPTGMTDVGVFRLKSELYETLDPISLHADSSQFQSISQALVKEISKTKKIPEQSVILHPKIIMSTSEFVNERIGAMMRTAEFTDLVYKLLMVAWRTKDEVFLPHLLHLMHAIVIDDELLYGADHVNQHLGVLHILDMLRHIAESSMSTQVVLKADFLLDHFVLKDEQSFVSRFGDEMFQLFKRRKVGEVQSDSDKLKKAAEKRKARVMKKFEKQRNEFMNKNGADLDIDMSEPSVVAESFLKKCVACGEVENADNPFVIALNTTETSVFWKIPDMNSPYADLAFDEFGKRVSPKDGELYPSGYPYESLGKATNGLVASTCAHGIHLSCRENNHATNYHCPLCHNLQNDVVNEYLYGNNKAFVSPDVLRGEPQNEKYNAILRSVNYKKNLSLLKSMVSDDYFDRTGTVKQQFRSRLAIELISRPSPGDTALDLVCKELIGLSSLIADTIRATEISFRIDGIKSVPNLLKDVPSSTKTLLRSLMQARVMLFEIEGEVFIGHEDKLIHHFENYWESHDGVDTAFNEVVHLFFQSAESLATLFRLGFAKSIAIISFALCKNYSDILRFTSIADASPLDGDTRTYLISFIRENMLEEEDIDSSLVRDELFLTNLYFALERCLMPYLRQCTIFLDVLTSEKIGQNDFKSHQVFDNFEKMTSSQSRVYSADSLCEILGLPSLKEFLKSIVEQERSFKFERGILDIHFHAKIPGQLDRGILNLEYPNTVHLIPLPEDYNDTITDSKNDHFITTCICLKCGERVQLRHSHFQKCAPMPICYLPESNNLSTFLQIDDNSYEMTVPAPYLTPFGEVKRGRSSGVAVLNKFRYDTLNKLWINQGFFGHISRMLRSPPTLAGMPDTFDAVFEDEDDSEDEW